VAAIIVLAYTAWFVTSGTYRLVGLDHLKSSPEPGHPPTAASTQPATS
jgi:hypothetical protein